MRSTKARNTIYCYAFAWKVFSSWCADVGRPALPATEDTIANFVVWSLYERTPRPYRLGSVRLTLTAINDKHRDAQEPCPVTKNVWTLVRNAARDLRERLGGKDRITPGLLRRVCTFLSDGSLISLRDRAMILLQFAAGWRCSEVVSLDLADVRFTRKGLILNLGASKTDQDGSEGRIVGIEYGIRSHTCPVRTLKEWREARGRWPGPLFCRVTAHDRIVQHGLVGDRINERLKRVLRQLGIDHLRYGSHSLRVGMVTAGIERGASETLIMMRTGHKSLDSMRRYVRSARAFRADPLEGVL